ncbi:MAG TPA: glycosyltransferase family 9 protein [Flavobacteriales bacterium]|nr:glycosyltransferase family 9 protein [Flavobacteriales bacterium]HRO38490.1 glycosyltransferase family 9 protein [Flavobacteriales bacterium]HRP82095.1 glycosyltransferase family 9 protein [Flavobacteriales bacterium]HRQ84753.1 glycosyltransferase family 9 protein [Flavobacteriales bacterium]
MNVPGTLILSRPDNLGDAVVTLPMAGWIKQHAPGTRIIALARRYTEPVWRACDHIDDVLILEDLREAGEATAVQQLRDKRADAIVHVFPQREVARWAKTAGIPRRIGTSHRWWHWATCNERVSFSRRRSNLHEAALNIKLLAPFGVPMPDSTNDLVPFIGLRVPQPSAVVAAFLRKDRLNIILHPLKASGVDWGLGNFAKLITLLDPARYHCILTGTAAEAGQYRKVLPVGLPHVTDTGGKLPLADLMALIGASDALVAASTGPLHIAAALGIRTIGLFSLQRPIHPGRWAPLGRDAHVLVNDGHCAKCAKGLACDGIKQIAPERVLALLPR